MIPTWSSSCRESPKVLGIANSFAGGVFLAIAFMHITPEMIETWDGLPVNEGKEKIFPLPELLIFCGYTFILVIDKVLFDTHALFEHDQGVREVDAAVGDVGFVQDNMSLSAEVGTIRGLHFQSHPTPQGKLIRCLAGAILDVAVDIDVGHVPVVVVQVVAAAVPGARAAVRVRAVAGAGHERVGDDGDVAVAVRAVARGVGADHLRLDG